MWSFRVGRGRGKHVIRGAYLLGLIYLQLLSALQVRY